MGTYGGTTGSTGTRGSPPHGYRVAPTLVAMGDVRRVCGDAWLLQAHQSFARSGCDLLDNRKWPLLKTVDDDVCIHGSQSAYMYCKPPYLNHTVHRNAVPASLQRCRSVFELHRAALLRQPRTPARLPATLRPRWLRSGAGRTPAARCCSPPTRVFRTRNGSR